MSVRFKLEGIYTPVITPFHSDGEIDFDALADLAALAERLLQLSRLEAGFARSETVADLLPVVSLLVRDSQRAGTRIDYEVPPGARLDARINLDAFALAVTNLLDNAAKWANRQVIVTLEHADKATSEATAQSRATGRRSR